MIAKIRQQGGAGIVTIPATLLRQLDLTFGASVNLTVTEGKLMIEPQKSSRRRKRYSLAELLQGKETLVRLTAETAWAREGDPVGREIA